MIAPIGVMIIGTFLPSGYKLFLGQPAFSFSQASILAVPAIVCHSIWLVWARDVREDRPDVSEAMRAFAAFAFGAAVLLVLSSTDHAKVIESTIRGINNIQAEFWPYATVREKFNLFAAGLMSAVAILSIVTALSLDSADNLAPYQYTVAAWGVGITFIFQRGSLADDVLASLAVASLVILAGAVWLAILRARGK